MILHFIFTSEGKIVDEFHYSDIKSDSSFTNIGEFLTQVGIDEKEFELGKEYKSSYHEKPCKFVVTKFRNDFQIIGFDLSEVETLKEELDSQRRISDLNMVRLLKALDDHKEVKISLERINEYKEEFISNISHKMRSSLTDIVGLTEILPDMPKEDQADFLEMIKKSANELLELIKDFQNS